jgi:hypothetical protein
MGDEKLDLRMTAEPKNFSPFTVRSPIDITGTFLNPKVSPKKAPIAARVVGGILLTFVNPLAAILPFLDPGKLSDSEVSCEDTLQHLKNKTGQSKTGNDTKALKSEAQDDVKNPSQRGAQVDAQTRDAQANMK